MAHDRSRTTHHLTQNGWSSNTERPSSAVETWTCDTEQASAFSTEYRTWSCIWADQTADTAMRDEIRRKFEVEIGMVASETDGVKTSIGKPL